ncbi:hypothetical protein [Roseobacter sp. CCS2]|uniref:hypothetical protein n=1 Tax=Roseobacter sp. CCS2 TaxID=391593 RepID=UPI0012EA586C|nr:hypothetical protein [Roseobacter sp. CCS2]
MFITDPDIGVLDIVEADPRRDGAYAPFLGSVDCYGPKRSIRVTTTFPFDIGRLRQRKAIIRAVIAAALEAAA